MNEIEELRERFLQLQESDGISELDLNKIEEKLEVKLPLDFRKISMFYSGGYLGGISNYSFIDDGNNFNIVDETIRLRREIGLPKRFIVLAEPPESIIVMDTENVQSIIWCDSVEVDKLENKSFITKPDEWNSYSEYFGQLIEDEEDEF